MCDDVIGGNIRVVARIRPVCETTKEKPCVTNDAHNERYVHVTNSSGHVRRFEYDSVLGPETLQSEAYEATARPIVQSVMDGFNGAVIAYGQTASGKTHTMYGDAMSPGIIRRASRDIFAIAGQRRGLTVGPQYSITVAYLQLYKENVYCMIEPRDASGHLRRCSVTSYGVQGVCSVAVRTHTELMQVVAKAGKNRVVAETKMNMDSSRSHAVCIITVTSTSSSSSTAAQLYLCDLAGSESVDKTGSEGVTLEEAKKINGSLLALRRVIMALTEKADHVPYRDSVLTTLLKGALGGNSRTAMVVCVSPLEYNLRESVAALTFGMYTGTIETVAVKTVAMSTEQMERELMALHAKIEVAVMVQRRLHKDLAERSDSAAIAIVDTADAADARDSSDEEGLPTLRLPTERDYDHLAMMPPPEFVCPLSGDMFNDPVVLADGETYERTAAEDFLRRHGCPPAPFCDDLHPNHRLIVVPNVTLRACMAEHYASAAR